MQVLPQFVYFFFLINFTATATIPPAARRSVKTLTMVPEEAEQEGWLH